LFFLLLDSVIVGVKMSSKIIGFNANKFVNFKCVFDDGTAIIATTNNFSYYLFSKLVGSNVEDDKIKLNELMKENKDVKFFVYSELDEIVEHKNVSGICNGENFMINMFTEIYENRKGVGIKELYNCGSLGSIKNAFNTINLDKGLFLFSDSKYEMLKPKNVLESRIHFTRNAISDIKESKNVVDTFLSDMEVGISETKMEEKKQKVITALLKLQTIVDRL
jgi:hypothetical protein